jgi:protein-L-isoaspartate O-methyltransferase
MRSSYKSQDITYSEMIKIVTQLTNPTNILEIGILDGFSLQTFINSTTSNTNINAFDLFDDFNGNHSNKDELHIQFNNYKNVKIAHGDFYKIHTQLESKYDIIHIDIANTGETLDFVIENYIEHLTENGIIIFEGGSQKRDNVDWMLKYNKKPIYQTILKYKEQGLNIQTYGVFPSISVITNKRS